MIGKPGIHLDKAELLAVLLESILYGFSLLMFGETIWTLWFRRSSRRVNRKMFVVSCMLLMFSTLHLVLGTIRLVQATILLRDKFPGGPVGYLSQVTDALFLSKNYFLVAQTIVGDAVVLYRCYVVWQSKLIMILPGLLWCGTVVIGLALFVLSPYVNHWVFYGTISKWIKSFWTTSFTANFLATLLLVCRIWYVDWSSRRVTGPRQSRLRPILHIIADAGAIYTFALFTVLVCFVTKTYGTQVILNMVSPIVSITFYMVIIRIGMADYLASQSTDIPISSGSHGRRPVPPIQVHIETKTERKADHQGRQASQPNTGSTGRAGRIAFEEKRGEGPSEAGAGE